MQKGIRGRLSLDLCLFCSEPHYDNKGVQLWLLLLAMLLAVSCMSAQRTSQSRQDCFCVEKAENSIPAVHQKRWDFLTKEECSVRRVFGTFPSARKPGEWFEFLQNYLKFSCWEAAPIVPTLLSILHFVGCFPQVFRCTSVIRQSWKVYYLFWQSPAYFVKQYTLLLHLTGVTLKTLQFPFSLFERGFCTCCLVYLPEGNTARFLVNKSFVATFQWQVKQPLAKKKKKKVFLWYNKNLDDVLKLVSSGSLKKEKRRRIKER